MMESSSEDDWSDIGFTRNPCDDRPLKVDEDDISVFVGRQHEKKQFKLLVSAQRGGIEVAEGRERIGKTSFVNAKRNVIYSATGDVNLAFKPVQ